MNNEIKLDSKATNYLKDKLGGGSSGAVFQHNITISSEENSYNYTIVILNNSNSELTYNDILNYLKTHNFTYGDDVTNGYSLGVTGGQGGGTGQGCDNAFVYTEEGDEPTEVIAFNERNNNGITDYLGTEPTANVIDVVIPILLG